MNTNILKSNTIMKTKSIISSLGIVLCGLLILMVTPLQLSAQAPSLSILERVNIDATNFTSYTPRTASVGVMSVSVSGTSYKNLCNSSDTYIRLASSATMTLTAESGVITQVHFSPMTTAACSGNGMDGKFSANSGTVSGTTWSHATGVSSVVFTATSTADFRNFTVTLKHSSSTCPFSFPTSIAMSVAVGDIEEEQVNITGTTGYSVQSVSLSSFDLGGDTNDSELSSYTSIPSTITVLGEVAGTYYGTFDVEYNRYSPYSYYDISIPITVTVTGCADISSKTVTVNTVPAPTYNCSTGKWETTVSWEAVSGASRYGLQLQQYNSGWSNSGSAVYVSAPTTSYTYTNLTTGGRYRVGVAAQNQSCVPNTNTVATASNEFNTTCPAITDLSATLTGVLAHSANISWSATPGVCTTTYSVWVSKNSDFSSPVWTQTNNANTSHALTGLDSNTKYYVKVTAFNSCGESQTRTGNFTTAKELVDYRYMCVDLDLVHTDAATDNSELKITSAAGQSVKALRTLTLTIDGASANAVVTLSGTDLEFFKSDGTLINASNLTCDANGDMNEVITVAYHPTAYVSEVLSTPAISVNCDGNNLTFNGLVIARCLPAKFVIAARVGDVWLALPADIATDVHDGQPVMVDDIANPTQAVITMNTTGYSLEQMPADQPNIANARFKKAGNRIYFKSTVNSKYLRSSDAATSSTNALNLGTRASSYPYQQDSLFYEWQLQSNDLVTYQIVNSRSSSYITGSRSNNLGYNTAAAKWGMYSATGAIQELRLLPIVTELTELGAEVMEWSASAIALRLPDVSQISSNQVNIRFGSKEKNDITMTNINTGTESDLYKVEGLTVDAKTLADNACQLMIISNTAGTYGTMLRIPVLVSTETTTSALRTAIGATACPTCDVVILNGGKLTADGTKSWPAANTYMFSNLYVYPGGRLNVDGKSMGLNKQLYLRGGYSWLNPTTFAFPDAYINNSNFIGSGSALYDYYIDNKRYYKISLPYGVKLDDISDEVGYKNFSFWLQYYDGALRASGSQVSGWVDYTGSGTNDATYLPGDSLKAGWGYLVTAKPRKKFNSVATNARNRPFAIVRFPLNNKAFNTTNGGEENAKVKYFNIPVAAHGIAEYNGGTQTANNVGWNFVGNPYMATYKSSGDADRMQVGQLVENKPDGVHWDGSYVWDGTNVRYVTVVEPTSTDYHQYLASTTELRPFYPFFIQAKSNGSLSFSAASRVAKMPSHLLAKAAADKEVTILLDMSGNGGQDDCTGLILSDEFSPQVDLDDLVKIFGDVTTTLKIYSLNGDTRLAYNAMPKADAAEAIPLGVRIPVNGTYTIRLSDKFDLSAVESVILTDYEEAGMEVDLMTSDYTFDAVAELHNDTRFALSVKIKQGTDISTELINNGIDGLDKISLITSENGITLHGVPQDAVVFLFDMTGKLISRSTGSGERVQLNATTGVYNLRIVSGTEARTIRAIVK